MILSVPVSGRRQNSAYSLPGIFIRMVSNERSPKYPLATVVPYGQDNQRASKLVVAIFQNPSEKDPIVRKWFSEAIDVRQNSEVAEEVTGFLREHQVQESLMADRIMGCPHEEGIDYPRGSVCPKCTFWIGRDRFTHDRMEAGIYLPKVGRNDPCPCGSQKKYKKCCGR
jgi:hypothetical protein